MVPGGTPVSGAPMGNRRTRELYVAKLSAAFKAETTGMEKLTGVATAQTCENGELVNLKCTRRRSSAGSAAGSRWRGARNRLPGRAAHSAARSACSPEPYGS